MNIILTIVYTPNEATFPCCVCPGVSKSWQISDLFCLSRSTFSKADAPSVFILVEFLERHVSYHRQPAICEPSLTSSSVERLEQELKTLICSLFAWLAASNLFRVSHSKMLLPSSIRSMPVTRLCVIRGQPPKSDTLHDFCLASYPTLPMLGFARMSTRLSIILVWL